MFESIKKNWLVYLMEFGGIAGFVLIAGLSTIFMEHPDLPVMKSELQNYPLVRRTLLGLVLGIYITLLVLLIGKKSGAHINPSATWTFYRLCKINLIDAVFFTVVQFAGAISAALFLKYALGKFFSNPLVNYGVTKPKPPHESITAFIAEFIISFILMLMILMASSSRRYEKYVALMSGFLIAVYIIIELPYSGMSLNPARSFAGALAGDQWKHLWMYFVAPTLAMLAASEVFLAWKEKNSGLAVYDNHPTKIKFMRSDYKEIPHYPVEKAI